jgi:hypothetical protein
MKVTVQAKKQKKNRIVNSTNRGRIHRNGKEHAHLGIKNQRGQYQWSLQNENKQEK